MDNARKLVATCRCGAVIQFVNLYITSSHQLLTTGLCTNCDIPLKVIWPFEELIANCPEPPEPPAKKQKLIAPPSDNEFLHSMGISDELDG